MIVEVIAKNAGAEQEEREYYPSPSKVGQCIRALTYSAIGVKPTEFPDRAIMIFNDGHWHEELIKDAIRGTAFRLTELKGKQQRIVVGYVNGRVVDGEIDGLVEDPLGKPYLLEIKSINHFGFERLKGEPQEDHHRQSNLYLHGLVLAGFDIKQAIIIYKNKNTNCNRWSKVL